MVRYHRYMTISESMPICVPYDDTLKMAFCSVPSPAVGSIESNRVSCEICCLTAPLNGHLTAN